MKTYKYGVSSVLFPFERKTSKSQGMNSQWCTRHPCSPLLVPSCHCCLKEKDTALKTGFLFFKWMSVPSFPRNTQYSSPQPKDCRRLQVTLLNSARGPLGVSEAPSSVSPPVLCGWGPTRTCV